MSGDVQPRKRKDKKRKRDALDRKPEGDISRQSSFQDEDESSHGVHITKMGTDDVHLHIHHDHGTGGHWCAKVLFFTLLAILLGVISLIILENRGLSDLDTPLSESRFSNYFDGWVEEHREEHGHDAVEASIQEHEEHDEPFEEEEDDDEADEEEDEEDEDEHDAEDDEDDNEKDTQEDTEENIVEDPSAETDKQNDDEEEDEENLTEEVSKEQTVEDEDDNDDDDEDNGTNDDDAENDEEQVTKETAEDNENNASNADEEDEDEEDEQDENTVEAEDAEESNEPLVQQNSQQTNENDNDEDDDNDDDNDNDNDNDKDADSKNDDPFDEEDDDGTFESLENVVDNDAEEMALLKEKARQQAEEAEKNALPSAEDNEEGGAASSWASSLAVKIGVGVALALVARLVLIRKNPNSTDEPLPEVVMKRRLTIATAEDTFPEDEEVPLLPEDEQYSEEEIEIEEEIEYVDDDDEQDAVYIKDKIATEKNTYMPETFEELNAQYRPKDYKPTNIATEARTTDKQTDNVYDNKIFNKATVTTISTPSTSTQASHQFSMPSTASPSVQTNLQNITPKTTLSAQSETNDIPYTAASSSVSAQKPSKVVQSSPSPKPIKRVVTHDVDALDSEEDLDYDPDDIYDGEELSEEEEEVEIDEDILDEASDEISDVDDTELMNRLEAKYGRLPTKEYESDEDPDDPTWTQIKPKQPSDNAGGAQAYNIDDNDENEYYDDLFEKELRRANEEMLRELNYL